ncbi:MAG: phosphomannomutase/phosphoglucomutase [Planctomycetota bacterium]|nr:phosphomannomutase/phosphoglucomutase [Planctomycetota bacterium]MDI6787822.1 phosphomannomutase/phosphoglucomutase [Planctomycetota bacterium]
MSIFKAYDIRGKYPSELDEAKARAIGWALVQFLHSALCVVRPPDRIRREDPRPKTLSIVVGRDFRVSSPALSANLIKGLLEGGAEVADISEVTTPMLYFASGFYHFDASVMVTASHNPPEYNGFKICRENAIALSETTGLRDIENTASRYKKSSDRKMPPIKRFNIIEDYKKFILRFIRFSHSKKPIKIVVDTTNGSVGPVFDEVFSAEPTGSGGKGTMILDIVRLFFEPDGRFPNHEPNPMKDENVIDLKSAIKERKADLGAAFDGDGDRVIFFDENANRIQNDLITALIARECLKEHPDEHIVYDLRSSRMLKEEIEKMGGKGVRERVGHAFIKATMRKYNAPFGGELSGHYYYRDNFFADSGLITFIYLINIIAREDKPISQIIQPLQRYYSSGELNFVVQGKEEKMKQIAREFSDRKPDYLDGITIEYPDWWFNLRPSNTEPLLRLNIEADTPEKLALYRQKIINMLVSC